MLLAEYDGGCLEQVGEPTHTQLCRQPWSSLPLPYFVIEVRVLTLQMPVSPLKHIKPDKWANQRVQL